MPWLLLLLHCILLAAAAGGILGSWDSGCGEAQGRLETADGFASAGGVLTSWGNSSGQQVQRHPKTVDSVARARGFHCKLEYRRRPTSPWRPKPNNSVASVVTRGICSDQALGRPKDTDNLAGNRYNREHVASDAAAVAIDATAAATEETAAAA